MNNNELRADAQELLALIGAGVSKTETLIEDFLALAEAGQVPEEVSDIDISEIVKAILKEGNDAITDKGITVKVEDGLVL